MNYEICIFNKKNKYVISDEYVDKLEYICENENLSYGKFSKRVVYINLKLKLFNKDNEDKNNLSNEILKYFLDWSFLNKNNKEYRNMEILKIKNNEEFKIEFKDINIYYINNFYDKKYNEEYLELKFLQKINMTNKEELVNFRR